MHSISNAVTPTSPPLTGASVQREDQGTCHGKERLRGSKKLNNVEIFKYLNEFGCTNANRLNHGLLTPISSGPRFAFQPHVLPLPFLCLCLGYPALSRQITFGSLHLLSPLLGRLHCTSHHLTSSMFKGHLLREDSFDLLSVGTPPLCSMPSPGFIFLHGPYHFLKLFNALTCFCASPTQL